MVCALFVPQKMNILEHFLQLTSTCKFLKLKQTVDTKIELETTIFDLQKCAALFQKAESMLYLLISVRHTQLTCKWLKNRVRFYVGYPVMDPNGS